MIENLGVGIDIVDVKRFKKIPYDSRPKFYKKIFLQSEINYCLKFKNSAEHFAGKFAVKEALKKSIIDKVDMLEIATSHYSLKPTVKLKNHPSYKFQISLSHDNDVAIAVVISEKIM